MAGGWGYWVEASGRFSARKHRNWPLPWYQHQPACTQQSEHDCRRRSAAWTRAVLVALALTWSSSSPAEDSAACSFRRSSTSFSTMPSCDMLAWKGTSTHPEGLIWPWVRVRKVDFGPGAGEKSRLWAGCGWSWRLAAQRREWGYGLCAGDKGGQLRAS